MEGSKFIESGNENTTAKVVEKLISTPWGDMTEKQVSELSDRDFEKIGAMALEDENEGER
jgi:hypothetical protein